MRFMSLFQLSAVDPKRSEAVVFVFLERVEKFTFPTNEFILRHRSNGKPVRDCKGGERGEGVCGGRR